jgi:hypothetical protein
MLKTAEAPVSQSDAPSIDGRHVLYDAFRRLSKGGTIKEYPGWKPERNKRWVGGLTSVGEVEGFEDVPLAMVLRESRKMVQLLVINQDAHELDRAADYKNGGWEFSDRDPLVMMNAVYLKSGRLGGFIASYRTQQEPQINMKGSEEFSTEDLRAVIPEVRQLGFDRIFDVISQSGMRTNLTTDILTSLAWRDYNRADIEISFSGGFRKPEWDHLIRREYGIN